MKLKLILVGGFLYLCGFVGIIVLINISACSNMYNFTDTMKAYELEDFYKYFCILQIVGFVFMSISIMNELLIKNKDNK